MVSYDRKKAVGYLYFYETKRIDLQCKKYYEIFMLNDDLYMTYECQFYEQS